MPSESDSVSTLESASSCWYATYRLPWLADRRSALDEAKVVSVKATAAQTSGGNFFIRELECLDFIVVQLIQPRRLPCGELYVGEASRFASFQSRGRFAYILVPPRL